MTEPNDKQIEAERLRQVRALIEELLHEFDVLAHVTLAGRHGRFETFTHVQASWSALHWEQMAGGFALRLRSNAADEGIDAARQKRELEWSLGALEGMGEMLAHTAIPILNASVQFSDKVGARHGPWEHDDPRT